MSLVHYVEDVDSDRLVALTCPQCKQRHTGDDLDEILELSGDGLRCVTLDCGASGLVAHYESQIAERFPESIATPFTPLPYALLAHRDTLGLGPHELMVIWALEHHRRAPGDEVWDEDLVERTGLSADKLKRATSKLVRHGLVTRRRSRMSDGRLGTMRYRLDPLWQRLAELTTARQCTVDDVTRSQDPATAHQFTVDHSAPVPEPGRTGAPSREEAFGEEPLKGEDPVGIAPADAGRGDDLLDRSFDSDQDQAPVGGHVDNGDHEEERERVRAIIAEQFREGEGDDIPF